MDEQDKESVEHLRKMIRKSWELALQSERLRLRSEELIEKTERLLEQFRKRKTNEPRSKIGNI